MSTPPITSSKEHLVPSPAPARSSWSVNTRRAAFIMSAVGLGIVAIWAAAGYSKEAPPPALAHAGFAVDGNAISLTPDAPQWKAVKLGTVAMAGKRWSDPVPSRVRVDETMAARIGAPLSGRVSAVFVELGQRVKVGDRLFSIVSAELADLRSDRMKSQVDLDVANASLDRIKALVEARATAGKDLLAAEAQAKQAELSVRLADAKIASLKIASRADNEFVVTAPRDGFIVDKHVLPSQQVTRDADALLMIAELSRVWVVAEVFETDAVGLTAGTLCKISLPSRPDVTIEAKVESVSSVVDPDRHTVAVRVVVPNPDGAMRPNVYAQMRCALEPLAGVVEVPVSAVVSNGAEQYVYLQERNGRFARRSIVAGSAREGILPVSEGLHAGDVIVEQGAILLDNQIELSN